MNSGYVYILVNASMPGVVKIGRTLRDARTRARALSTSGVPTPFQVAFELFSEDHQRLEERIHAELADFRVSPNREFFRYPLDRAISLLQELNVSPTEPEARFVAEDITNALRDKYPGHLRSDIVSVRIVQVPERVWLEITAETEMAGYLKDQTIHRSDLAFILDDDEVMFRPEDDVQSNARKFIDEFDPFSIIMTTDLFNKQVEEEINQRCNPLLKRRSEKAKS